MDAAPGCMRQDAVSRGIFRFKEAEPTEIDGTYTYIDCVIDPGAQLAGLAPSERVWAVCVNLPRGTLYVVRRRGDSRALRYRLRLAVAGPIDDGDTDDEDSR